MREACLLLCHALIQIPTRSKSDQVGFLLDGTQPEVLQELI